MVPDTSELLDAVDHLADRFRAMPQSRLLGAVPGHPSRAAAGLALARELAARTQRLAEGPGALPRELPDAGAFAVGDQIAVTGHDLVAALGDGAPENDEAAAALLADAVAAVDAVAKLCG
ncbi:hypothetical protein LN042_27895 [Kitasatospora sp. RB6PN24]|uniref:hypothetical protein n=1 Tax=Kitasatospora humi TaxID=2893891 RepID=UPI001E41AE64|nr:hypothetical protein [Kitasatospora humi]MCC9310848.1 hypothetical protein [Kitasatospora humi]